MVTVLKQRNFVLLWSGGLISVLGDQILNTALVFYVYRLTGSVLTTGIITVVYFLPAVLFGSVAGVFVDRWNLKRTVISSNLAQSIVLLPLLLVHSPGQVWLADAVAFSLATLSMFVGPATSVLVPRVVDEEHLVTANSLNSISGSVTRLLGPPIGGALLVWTGTTIVVVLDSISFLVAAILVAPIRLPARASLLSAEEVPGEIVSKWVARWRDWLHGIQIIRRQEPLAVIFLVGGLATVADAMLGPLLVPFVRNLLKGSALTYGWISVATGLGALLGAGVMGRAGKRLEPMRMVTLGLIWVGLIALVRYNIVLLPVAMATFFFGGLGATTWNIGRTTLLQTKTPDAYRGRVFGAWGTTTAVTLLAGSALVSLLGDRVGVLPLLECSAALYLLAGLLTPLLAVFHFRS